ncbi:MAG: 2-oxo acid dehydrogenase subunit E2 [Ruminococcus sp.]|nr:2-oxo acid dehydrogenase subunit E2 [Ruminococcus sp.]
MGRPDGKKLKNLGVEYIVGAHVMADRTDAMNMITIDLPEEPMKAYLNQKRKEGKRYSHLTLILAAMVRAFAEYPGLNRFVVNKRIYARNEISVGMVVLKGGKIDEVGTISKMKFKPTDTIEEVDKEIKDYIEMNRAEDEVNSTDKIANFLCSVPGLARVAVNFVKWLDKHNWCPKAIIEASPFHCSIILTDLASIKTNSIHHHIYNFGTVSISMAIGNLREVPVRRKGEIAFERCLPLGMVLDDRTVGGAYYSRAFRKYQWYLEHPETLEQPPEVVNSEI